MRAAFRFAAPLLLAACTHDFGPFEPVESDEGGARDARKEGTEDAEGGPRDAAKKKADAAEPTDAPCVPSTVCLDTASSCATSCKDTEATCTGGCGGSFHCEHVCMKTGTTCAAGCLGACTSCAESAGCPGTAQCQAAVE